ncbi:MAG: hypothetical protein NWQ01_01880, partial [Ilumatobacteraceae bacterium]|nr:hypothetical protein [Ilumatobacteraceae bacterium]
MTVHLQRAVKGAAAAEVRWLENISRRVVWVDVDETVRRGALSADASGVIAHAADTAREKGLPLIMTLGSSGADIVEGVAALHGWGLAAKAIAKCSGYVPIFTVVTGPAVSGPALLIGLSDIVIMTSDAYAFVTGPTMVAEFTGVVISNDELGGSDIHAKQSGVAHLVVADRQTALVEVEHVLSFLPDNVNEIAATVATSDSVDRLTPEAGALIPENPTGAYDVKAVIRSIADDGYLLELRERWAPNIVTGLITIG